MADAIYAKESDEIGHLATVTVSTATADANYPVANVQTFDPSQPFLTSSSGTAVNIDWDNASPIDAQLFSLHHHNIPAGTVITVTRGASQGAATETISHTVLAHPNTGLPLPIGLDLTTATGYSAAGYRWTRLHIPSLAQKVGIGSALLWSTKRADITNVKYPVSDGESHPKRVFRTATGTKKTYYLRVRNRTQPAVFQFSTEAEWTAFQALWRSCQDGNNAFLWWRDTTISDVWLAGFPSDDLDHALIPRHAVTTAIEELGCGRALPTV